MLSTRKMFSKWPFMLSVAVFLIFSEKAHAFLPDVCGGDYEVKNVESWDVLNIRSGPSHTHPKIGELEYDAICVEVVGECEGQWCQVRFLDLPKWKNGWVNSKYLGRMSD
ncbi:SH3 domain-containing protein [Hoeflea alexandrii]|uniref:SH3 domain-containing protein n=1 Tax=Hoeflea alexandrii TaxID=288436 RepID=UPI0035CF51AE